MRKHCVAIVAMYPETANAKENIFFLMFEVHALIKSVPLPVTSLFSAYFTTSLKSFDFICTPVFCIMQNYIILKGQRSSSVNEENIKRVFKPEI